MYPFIFSHMCFIYPVHSIYFEFITLMFGDLVIQYVHLLRLQDTFLGSVLSFFPSTCYRWLQSYLKILSLNSLVSCVPKITIQPSVLRKEVLTTVLENCTGVWICCFSRRCFVIQVSAIYCVVSSLKGKACY